MKIIEITNEGEINVEFSDRMKVTDGFRILADEGFDYSTILEVTLSLSGGSKVKGRHDSDGTGGGNCGGTCGKGRSGATISAK